MSDGISWAVGPLLVVGMVVAWVGVQSAWTRVFARPGADPDALAGRSKCATCAGPDRGSERCDRNSEDRCDPAGVPRRAHPGAARE